jgi:ABC-type multidrug transport system fused ATPase/permease subunit
MDEDDVWALSPGLASKPLFLKYSTFIKPSEKTKKRIFLLKRLWKANSLDLTLDFFLTLVSVICNYLSPFFLKRILDAVSQPSSSPSPPSNWFIVNILSSREIRAQAYVYALLAFLVSIIKAQSDVQHLWYGRRATSRIRSELMAAIFEKSLKRKDLSGSINKEDQAKEKDKAKDGGKGKGKADASGSEKESLKAGADIGKIVNLMSTDANRISNMVAALTMLYVSFLLRIWMFSNLS